MTHILIVYGTTDGHTRKIAQVLAENLRARRCSVDIMDAAGLLWRISPESYDGVIVAASVHIGDYQRTVGRWVRMYAPLLNGLPTAFLSVCLAVLERRIEARQEVLRIMTRFLQRCGWRPTITKMIAGAVPYTRYGWLKRQMMKRIVGKAGGDTDTTRDFEYTDWNDLRNFARDFAALAAQKQPEIGGVFSPTTAARVREVIRGRPTTPQ
jgi:menaquinone-dependent protoporphyrinogen oxidase